MCDKKCGEKCARCVAREERIKNLVDRLQAPVERRSKDQQSA